MKNVVICCDGTGEEFGDTNSNVVKLYSVLQYDPTKQIAYYHAGLGTLGAPNALTKLGKWWTRLLGLAFGYGLTANLSDAYTFLMNEYEAGDRLFLFGFSRGAYTARALAGLLHMFGLIRKGDDALVPYAMRLFKYRGPTTFRLAAEFKQTFSHECPPYFVGVWDTVSSVGWIYDPVKLPYTANNPDMRVGRHAISIDERRCFYRQNVWGPGAEGQDIKQVWFAGVHCDVGGGYPERESGLAKITLAWVLREATAAGLLVDQDKVDLVLGRQDAGRAPPDAAAVMHNSLRRLWWLLECWPKRYTDMGSDPPTTKWRLPLGARRRIPAGSLVHSSVLERMRTVPAYRPSNLPNSYAPVT